MLYSYYRSDRINAKEDLANGNEKNYRGIRNRKQTSKRNDNCSTRDHQSFVGYLCAET